MKFVINDKALLTKTAILGNINESNDQQTVTFKILYLTKKKGEIF